MVSVFLCILFVAFACKQSGGMGWWLPFTSRVEQIQHIQFKSKYNSNLCIWRFPLQPVWLNSSPSPQQCPEPRLLLPLGHGQCLWAKTLMGYFPFHLGKFKIVLENLDQTLGKKYSSKSPFISSDASISSRVWHCLAPT